MYPTLKSEKKFIYPKLYLSWPMYPPPPRKNQEKSSKIFVFRLHSTSDDRLSDPSDEN